MPHIELTRTQAHVSATLQAESQRIGYYIQLHSGLNADVERRVVVTQMLHRPAATSGFDFKGGRHRRRLPSDCHRLDARMKPPSSDRDEELAVVVIEMHDCRVVAVVARLLVLLRSAPAANTVASILLSLDHC